MLMTHFPEFRSSGDAIAVARPLLTIPNSGGKPPNGASDLEYADKTAILSRIS
jgi:hypothetical protein